MVIVNPYLRDPALSFAGRESICARSPSGGELAGIARNWLAAAGATDEPMQKKLARTGQNWLELALAGS